MRLLLLPLWLLLGCPQPDGGFGPTTDEIGTIDAEQSEVSVAAEGLTLEGTLLMPAYDEDEVVLGVVFVHGSGPNGRDEESPAQLVTPYPEPIEVFAELAEALQDAGIATLRYDKRTCFAGNGCDNDYPTPSDLLIDDFADDAQAALDWLAAQDGIGEVAVIGHSQGGGLVPQILDSGAASAGISLAGPWQAIDVLLPEQLDRAVGLLIEAGMSPQEAEDAIASSRPLADTLVGLRAGDFSAAEIAASPDLQFLQSWIDSDDLRQELVPTLSAPMLAAGGDYDLNVLPEEIAGWQNGFEGSLADPGHRTLEWACLTHSFNCISEPEWVLIEPEDIGREVDPRVPEAIASFLDEVLGG